MIPVNKQLQAVLKTTGMFIENAGLLLDKYHAECPGKEQKQELAGVAAITPRDAELRRRQTHRRAALILLGATRWMRTTAGPLTIQLSRAGSFENAGICLHPVYGFVYLPGTGVKGMARAFAETVAQATAEDIEAVFGKGAATDDDSAAGGVVFHEAWPTEWPRLIVDIVNNHHSRYYQGTGHDAPDDFEDPIPVCFLAIARGVEFEFALGLRQGTAGDQRLVTLARGWLDGALSLLGAGAKTNAGYGQFKSEGAVAIGPDFAQFSAELKLETPAFLAGAEQKKDDCELRPATLRGLLRWWWRTLHSAHLSVSELRKLEAKVWGDTEKGGAVALHVEPLSLAGSPELYNPREVANLDHPPDPRTTPGLLYDSYGMQASGGRPARCFLAPPATWRVTLTARIRKDGFSAAQSLDQARLALWMLVRYGGVGAKARRGFGSLTVNIADAPHNLSEAIQRAAVVRPHVTAPNLPISSAVERMQEKELRLRGNDPWFALDQLGYAYQSFASSEKHHKEKVALGLPRNIHKGREVEHLRHPAGQYPRHSSPLHFHVFRDAQGYAVRIAAFASPRLPDAATSEAYLKRCVAQMENWLAERQRLPAPPPRPASQVARTSAPARPAASPATFKVGDPVSGVLVEKNKKGTWKARVEGFSALGPITSKDMPPSFKEGDTVHLKVSVSKPNDPAFVWVKE